MKVTNQITIHLDDARRLPPVDVMQGDANTRELELTLLAGGAPWVVPANASAAVAYRRSDGVRGLYDTLPDGTAACTVAGNVVTATLVPQALVVPGKAEISVILMDHGGAQLATFCIPVKVDRNPAAGATEPGDYTNIEGVSTMPRPMDIEEIERVNKLEKTQRALERKVRQAKRREAGLADPEAQKNARAKVRTAQAELREFVKANGDVLRRDLWRERYDGTKLSGDGGAPEEIQYRNYQSRLGDRMPAGGFQAFLETKMTAGESWTRLQEDYRYTGIIDRILKKAPDAVVCSSPEDIPAEYHDAAQNLTPEQKDGLYHYSHYSEGVRMNKALGGVPGVDLSEAEQKNLANAADALQNMSLPQNTVLWRGTDPKLLKGFELLDQKDLVSWKHKPLSMDGFASTSILRSASYSGKPVQMVILAPKGLNGAGYIDGVSYNAVHFGIEEDGFILKKEYEVLLQKGSRFDIIEAQRFNGKLILVVKWEENLYE